MSYDSGAFAQRGEHKVAVGKTLFIAAVCAIVPLIGNVVASFLTTWTGVGSWLVVPAVGVGVAMLTALIQAYGSAPAQERRRSPAGPYRPVPVRPRRARGGRPKRRYAVPDTGRRENVTRLPAGPAGARLPFVSCLCLTRAP